MDPDLDPKRRQSIDNTVAFPIKTENPNHSNLTQQITYHTQITFKNILDKKIITLT